MRKILEPSIITSALREQVAEEIYDLFTWSGAKFTFESHQDIAVSDAEDRPEQEGVHGLRAAGEEAKEQETETQREGEDRAHRGRLGAVTRLQAAADPADAQRGSDAERDQSQHGRHVGEHPRRGAWKSDLGKHVGGKGLAAQDDEVARRAGEQGDQRPRQVGVLHEMELQQSAEHQ